MKTNFSHSCFRPKKKEPFLLNSKFIAVFFIVSLLLPLLAIAVSSHPGRTDSNGGHYNRSTGEYHYHHGYPAHQHLNGICPYDFDNKTASNSSSRNKNKHKSKRQNSTESVKSQTAKDEYALTTVKNKESKNELTDSRIRKYVGIALICILVVIILIEIIKK